MTIRSLIDTLRSRFQGISRERFRHQLQTLLLFLKKKKLYLLALSAVIISMGLFATISTYRTKQLLLRHRMLLAYSVVKESATQLSTRTTQSDEWHLVSEARRLRRLIPGAAVFYLDQYGFARTTDELTDSAAVPIDMSSVTTAIASQERDPAIVHLGEDPKHSERHYPYIALPVQGFQKIKYLYVLLKDEDLPPVIERSFLQFSSGRWFEHFFFALIFCGTTLALLLKLFTDRYRQLISTLADASHDLKTPLTSIKGYLELLRTRGINLSSEQYHFYLGIISQNVEKLLSLTRLVLDLSAIENEAHSVEFAPVSLVDVISDLIAKFTPVARAHKIELRAKGPESLCLIQGNTRLLERMFSNVLDNCIRHTRPGGIITIKLNETESSIVLAIRDSGLGITDDAARTLESKANDKLLTGSYGLGLKIAKRVAELHHAELSIASAKGAGSLFEFTFHRTEQQVENAA